MKNQPYSTYMEERFGTCPQCGKTNGYINIGKSHFFFCRNHRLSWSVGWNLFSVHETEQEQRKIFDEMEFGTYREASPIVFAEAARLSIKRLAESKAPLTLDNVAAMTAELVGPVESTHLLHDVRRSAACVLRCMFGEEILGGEEVPLVEPPTRTLDRADDTPSSLRDEVPF